MLARAQDDDTRSRAAQGRARHGAILRGDRRGEAGRRHDPLRRRAGRRRRTRPQAPAARPRHLDHGTRPALRNAIARKAFARSFKRDVRIGADLVEATERLLERAALDALAMAHKAGQRRHRLRQDRGGAVAQRGHRTVPRVRCRRRRGAQACRHGAPSDGGLANRLSSLMGLLRRNWIWHWGDQM